MQKILIPIVLFIVFVVLPGCSSKHEVDVKPIEIKPAILGESYSAIKLSYFY